MQTAVSAAAVSYLFVPASRPDRYQKALQSAADSVIIDLEDAVSTEDKDSARAEFIAALRDRPSRPVHVRTNAPGSRWFAQDLRALDDLGPAERASLAGIFIPKAEQPDDVRRVIEMLECVEHKTEVIVFIESAAGLAAAHEFAAISGVTRFAVGAADLSVDLDAEINSVTIDWAYAQLVLVSRIAGIAGPIASPTFEIRDQAVVAREAKRLRGLGATAQLCIHPTQVESVNEGFLPSAEQIAWAKRISAATGGIHGAVQVAGQMVDQPVWEKAMRILAQVR